MNIERCIVYDVEIIKNPDEVEGGWDNPEAMGFASAVAYSYEKDQYYFFLHEKAREEMCDFLHGKIAVTFNGIHFDSRVMLGNDRMFFPDGRTAIRGTWWDNYDILLEYIKTRFAYSNVRDAEVRLGDKAIHDGSFGLDGLAYGTLGLNKTGHGAMAPDLYSSCLYHDLLSYNLQDVRLTKKLFNFIRRYGFVVDRIGRSIRIAFQ